MNITSAVTFFRKRKAAQMGVVAASAAQVGAIGMALTVSDIIQHQNAVQSRKTISRAYDKITSTIAQIHRKKVPESEAEEVTTSLGEMFFKGAVEVVKLFAKTLFKFVVKAISYVIAPVFSFFFSGLAAAFDFALIALRSNPYAFAIGTGVLALGAAWVYFRKPSEGAPVAMQEEEGYVSTVPEVAHGNARGLRNNNPGNLVFARQTGATKEANGGFAVFQTQAEGLYALSRQLQLYAGRGENTLRVILHKYAPPHENNTERYIATVAKRMGVEPTETLDLQDKSVLRGLMEAIIRFENGSQPYSDAQLDEAVARGIRFAQRNTQALTSPPSAEPVAVAGGSLVNPLPSGRVTSRFGPRQSPVEGASAYHRGMDIAAPAGTLILAAGAGTVSYAGPASGYGTLIVIDHADRIKSLYGHARKIIAMVGDKVTAGQPIGEVGNMGISTGPHLHFEVQSRGTPVDPAVYISSLPAGESPMTAAPPPVAPAPVVAPPKASGGQQASGTAPQNGADRTFVRKNDKLLRMDN